MSLPKLAVLRPITTSMLIISVLVIGGIAFVKLPHDYLPSVDAPFIQVQVPIARNFLKAPQVVSGDDGLGEMLALFKDCCLVGTFICCWKLLEGTGVKPDTLWDPMIGLLHKLVGHARDGRGIETATDHDP